MEKEIKEGIYAKIQAVANEVLSIDKDMTVGRGNYAYKAVSDLSVTKAVKEAELWHRIVSIPTKQELIHQEVIRTTDGEKESIRFSFIVKMTVLFVNLDDPSETLEVESYGHGLDNGDKGFGKASTYARKTALLNAYKIATGEDPDATKSEEIRGVVMPNEKRIAVTNYLDSNTQTMTATLQHFGLSKIEDASQAQINTMYATLQKKKLI